MREVAARETEPQATVPGPVERDLRHNFAALLGHGLLGQTGFRLIQAPTFLPYFVSTLAGTDSAAPLMRAMQSLGQFASPMLSASIAEHRRRTKGLALLFGSGMRLQVLFLALIALFVPAESALVLVFCVAGLLGLSLGLQGVVFQFVMSKAIPVERRGMLFGLRNASASVTLVFVALLGGFLVERYGFPHGYGYTFLVGFVLTSLGLVALAWCASRTRWTRAPACRSRADCARSRDCCAPSRSSAAT
jgi:MFS family permease